MQVPRKPPPHLAGDLTVIKLFEIADRLADQAAEGSLHSASFIVDTTWKTLEVAWLSATIFNDGDSDVYIHLDDMSTAPWQEGEAPLKKGEHLVIDLKARGHKPPEPEEKEQEGRPRVRPLRFGSPVLCFICQTGTATIRAFRLT